MASYCLQVPSLLLILLLGRAAGTQLDIRQWIDAQSSTGLEGDSDSSGRITLSKEEKLEQSLRICNAYADSTPLNVLDLKTNQMVTQDQPLAFKNCGDFKLALQEGDQLDFRASNRSVGVFRAMGLPKFKGSLLLIARRRHPNSISASFESHAFTDLGSSQIVVVDAYRGSQAGAIKIVDDSAKDTPAGPQRQEDLRFSSVVSVGPGHYQVVLQDASGENLAAVPMSVGQGAGKYVVMRTGNEPEAKALGANLVYAQDLVVYPQSTALPTARPHLPLAAFLLAAALALAAS